jgi:deoxyhypusine synthase
MKVKTTHGMGSHLLLEGFEGDRKLLDSTATVKRFLETLPRKIGMKRISEAIVLKHRPSDQEEAGITGFVIIAESHISVHTYPHRNYLALDVFSCKEFEVQRIIKEATGWFRIRRESHKVVSRGFEELIDTKGMLPIKGPALTKNTKVRDLVRSMKSVGFQATNLSKAADIIARMKKEQAKIFLSFTSNMVSSGLREVIADLVKRKQVDVIITSVGSIEEDLMKAKHRFLLGDFDVDDTELHRKGINRIGNIFVPNACYESLEDDLVPFFKRMYDRQLKGGRLLSPRELIHELGKTIKDKESILFWATKNGIPIFCPGITDGAFGLQLYFFKQKFPKFGIDVSADMKELADHVLLADKTGGIILGGGIAKHHTIGVNILRGGLDYAVYVTTATEHDGSLSGARASEAKSWSKIQEEGNTVVVYADATIVLPLLAATLDDG